MNARRAAALALLLFTCTACPAERPRPLPSRTPSQAPAGTITVAYPYEPVTMDPAARGGDGPATTDLLGFLGGTVKPADAPFKLRTWHRGLDMIFDANPNAASPPKVATIRVAFVPDALGALELLKNGTVDMLGPYLAPDWQRRLADAGARTASLTGTSWAGLRFGEKVNATTRARLVASFDRDRLVRGLVQAEGTPFDGVPAARYAPGAKTKLTLAVPESDDLLGVLARAVQFQARARLDVQPIGIEPSELYGTWLAGSRMQVAMVLERRTPSAAAIRNRLVVPLFHPSVTIAWRDEVVCDADVSADGGAFAHASTWERCP